MSDLFTIAKVCAGGCPAIDVIFVHGLTGKPLETWTSADKTYWPEWLCSEFPNIAVYTIGYPSSLFGKFSQKEMDIHERANSILEHLASYGFGERPLVFICHSLGGILVKEILRASRECSDDAWQLIAQKTRLIAFLGTPHLGASLASAISMFAPHISSDFTNLLTKGDGYLVSLNLAFRDYAHAMSPNVVSYYEKWKTKNAAIVVDRQSADPGVGITRPIGVDADHISIRKPADKNAIQYISICRHIKSVLKNAACSHRDATFEADDFSTASPSDRRDLLQKLIDAGREHEYSAANDLQNKFSQKYHRLGLFTEAKITSDNLLSDVLQRFTTHVYLDKICKNASDDQISEALQNHVINPLCSHVKVGGGPSATSILQALYFLTEQCYIKWDAK